MDLKRVTVNLEMGVPAKTVPPKESTPKNHDREVKNNEMGLNSNTNNYQPLTTEYTKIGTPLSSLKRSITLPPDLPSMVNRPNTLAKRHALNIMTDTSAQTSLNIDSFISNDDRCDSENLEYLESLPPPPLDLMHDDQIHPDDAFPPPPPGLILVILS